MPHASVVGCISSVKNKNAKAMQVQEILDVCLTSAWKQQAPLNPLMHPR